MSYVRPFEEADIPQVVELHGRIFPPRGGSSGADLDEYRSYCRETFLLNPWAEQGPASLVCQESDGEIIGFLGVMARRLSLEGRPIRAAITSQFMVEPSKRSTLAGVQLIQALLASSPDLVLADEASDGSRAFWEGLGGATALLYSLYWVRPLRPARCAVSRVTTGRGLASLVWGPPCDLVDGVATRLRRSPFFQSEPRLVGGELDEETLAQLIARFAERRLRPAYDRRALRWLFEMLARKKGCGTFRKTAVHNAAREILGWYLYYVNPGGIGEVIQVGARPGAIGAVLQHLFHDAWRRRVAGLVGRLDPWWVHEFSKAGCFFRHRGHWTLVHSPRPDLLEVIRRGDAFLTRLEGEWCMRFRGAAA